METLRYLKGATCRRRMLDELQQRHARLLEGVVLDIGGRDRGRFRKPRDAVRQWVFVDIVADHGPDVAADVAALPLRDGCADVVYAMELFEHVAEPRKALEECNRVLRENGRLVCSTPFLYPVHADPHDYARWTRDKWRMELEACGFDMEEEITMGGACMVLLELVTLALSALPPPLKWLKHARILLFEPARRLDGCAFMKRGILSGFHGGYYIVARKRG